jgi:TorA maturation chaperone TorD
MTRARDISPGRAGWSSEEHDGAPDGALADRELVALRAMKFRALATLYRLDIAYYLDAIDTIMMPCALGEECPLTSPASVKAGKEARNWVENVANEGTLQAEHVRLFGGADRKRQMPSVADCGAMWADGEDGSSADDVLAFYERYDFVPSGQSACPSHVANELEFMAHLLEHSLVAEDDALDAAADFLVTHLFSWGVVFSAATYSKSEHPMTRFAGLMLENLLFCEAEHARIQRARLRLTPPDSAPS